MQDDSNILSDLLIIEILTISSELFKLLHQLPHGMLDLSCVGNVASRRRSL